MLKTYLIVMAGGAIGTGCRMWLSTLVAIKYGEIFPTGTLVVNISGCFLIGLFYALTGPGGAWMASPLLRQFVMIGMMGGYTTFSSFSLQTLNLVGNGEWFRGALNVTLSVALCLAAAWIGGALGAAINQKR